MNLIEIKNLKKFYQDRLVLDIKSLNIPKGKIVVILGKSGCGKSTLLNILATIDNEVSKGSIVNILGQNVINMTEAQRANFRKENIGFIFQTHELIPEFNVIENCTIPLILQGVPNSKAIQMAKEALKKVDICENEFYKKPNSLSGGQQQRVAVVRAVIHHPKIIFADEPTGNLDPQTTKQVIELLKSKKDKNTTLIVVTHDNQVKEELADIVFKFQFDENEKIYKLKECK